MVEVISFHCEVSVLLYSEADAFCNPCLGYSAPFSVAVLHSASCHSRSGFTCQYVVTYGQILSWSLCSHSVYACVHEILAARHFSTSWTLPTHAIVSGPHQPVDLYKVLCLVRYNVFTGYRLLLDIWGGIGSDTHDRHSPQLCTVYRLLMPVHLHAYNYSMFVALFCHWISSFASTVWT
jgi:hypothetical protein